MAPHLHTGMVETFYEIMIGFEPVGVFGVKPTNDKMIYLKKGILHFKLSTWSCFYSLFCMYPQQNSVALSVLSK